MTRASRRLWGEDSINLWSQSIVIHLVKLHAAHRCIYQANDVANSWVHPFIHILSINPLYSCPYQSILNKNHIINFLTLIHSPINPSIHPSIHPPVYLSIDYPSIIHPSTIHLSYSSLLSIIHSSLSFISKHHQPHPIPGGHPTSQRPFWGGRSTHRCVLYVLYVFSIHHPSMMLKEALFIIRTMSD